MKSWFDMPGHADGKGQMQRNSSGHLRLVDAVPDLSDLLERTAQGDAAAFRQVFELTSTRLFGIAMHVLQDRYLAEHALLDAYLHIRRDAAGHAARADIIEALAAVVRRTSNEMATQVVGIVTRSAVSAGVRVLI